MGRNYLLEMPREILDTNRKDVVAWWCVKRYRNKWEAKRALLQWAEFRRTVNPRFTGVDALTIRSVMSAIEHLASKNPMWNA